MVGSCETVWGKQELNSCDITDLRQGLKISIGFETNIPGKEKKRVITAMSTDCLGKIRSNNLEPACTSIPTFQEP